MLTRGILQFIIPTPIEQFDHAKVFENSWEYYWKEITGNSFFSQSVDKLWDNSVKLPPIFINSTRVEDGYPFIVSSLKLKNDSYNFV